jgi:hypothetical protein
MRHEPGDGRYWTGVPVAVVEPDESSHGQARQLRERAAAGERKSALATEFGISRETVYGYLRAETFTR